MVSSKHFVAVGTVDGSIQLYGSSPTSGLKCGSSFRSHSQLVLGWPIVSMNLSESETQSKLLVVCADGSFFVTCAILPYFYL